MRKLEFSEQIIAATDHWSFVFSSIKYTILPYTGTISVTFGSSSFSILVVCTFLSCFIAPALKCQVAPSLYTAKRSILIWRYFLGCTFLYDSVRSLFPLSSSPYSIVAFGSCPLMLFFLSVSCHPHDNPSFTWPSPLGGLPLDDSWHFPCYVWQIVTSTSAIRNHSSLVLRLYCFITLSLLFIFNHYLGFSAVSSSQCAFRALQFALFLINRRLNLLYTTLWSFGIYCVSPYVMHEERKLRSHSPKHRPLQLLKFTLLLVAPWSDQRQLFQPISTSSVSFLTKWRGLTASFEAINRMKSTFDAIILVLRSRWSIVGVPSWVCCCNRTIEDSRVNRVMHESQWSISAIGLMFSRTLASLNIGLPSSRLWGRLSCCQMLIGDTLQIKEDMYDTDQRLFITWTRVPVAVV